MNLNHLRAYDGNKDLFSIAGKTCMVRIEDNINGHCFIAAKVVDNLYSPDFMKITPCFGEGKIQVKVSQVFLMDV